MTVRAGSWAAAVVAVVLVACASESPSGSDVEFDELAHRYVEAHFERYPSRATTAGRSHLDGRLESFPVGDMSWLETTKASLEELEALVVGGSLDAEQMLDAELLLRRMRLEIFQLETQRVLETNPLTWSGTLANATIFLLVRDDRPAPKRFESALERARQIPRLAAEAQSWLSGNESEISPEFSEIAASQLRRTAEFYRGDFARPAAQGYPELAASMAEAGVEVATAIDELATFMVQLATRASGSFRLGELYQPRFALVTGDERQVSDVLQAAESALAAKRKETAAFVRDIWPDHFEGPAPEEDVAAIKTAFDRIASDTAESGEAFVAEYRDMVGEVIEFVRQNDVVEIPEPLPIVTDRSPAFFSGQAVGGVYPAGPYSPEGATLFYLPTPPPELDEQQVAAFYRDFNHHFNVMIIPHEVVPGHMLQLAWAARHPRKVRALFGDGVYTEGWGTFSERLMLDLGWGDDLARVAHLKKQLENIARTIVDIRVHTTQVTRDEIVRYVQEEALQEERFATNMWRRAMTTSPQITSYWMGYEQVMGLYEEVRAHRGDAFVLRDFMDGMMELGPVPVARYKELMLDG